MEHNNLWQALLREVQRKKENNYVFCEYRVHLKSGDFIIQIKDGHFEKIECANGIVTLTGYLYPKGTRLTLLHEYEMSQLSAHKFFIPVENIDFISTD